MRAEGAAARVTEEIVEFLIARYDEEDALAREQLGSEPDTFPAMSAGGIAASVDSGMVYINHARLRADVAAKRRIVLERPWPAGRNWDLVRAWHDTTVRLLALQYAEHPDYREEWRP